MMKNEDNLILAMRATLLYLRAVRTSVEAYNRGEFKLGEAHMDIALQHLEDAEKHVGGTER